MKTTPPSHPRDESPANRQVVAAWSDDTWGWELELDGALAVERQADPHRPSWTSGPASEQLDAAGTEGGQLGLKGEPSSDSVTHVARPEAYALGPDGASGSRPIRIRFLRLAVAIVSIGLVATVAALVVDRWTGTTETAAPVLAEPSSRLLPGGPPEPQVVALLENLRLFLPIAPERITAIGFRASGETALPLDPVGTRANAGLLERVKDKIFGGEASEGLRYYLIGGGVGAQTGGLDIGAPAGTNVYAPVDGTVLAVNDVIVSGEHFGHRIDLSPTTGPGLVAIVTNLDVDPNLTVGAPVVASETRLGQVLDLSEVEQASLARFTQDRGQHVHLEVHPAADLALP